MIEKSFVEPNIMKSPAGGYQLWAVASSADWASGVSERFRALVDPGAKHTSVGKSIMDGILSRVRSEDNSPLQILDMVKTRGAFGDEVMLPQYIIPNMYLGKMHFVDVSVLVSDGDNYECLLGRSILNSCILTLNPLANEMTFTFLAQLAQCKALPDGVKPFTDVYEYTELGNRGKELSSSIKPERMV
jgi:hypothetical protein